MKQLAAYFVVDTQSMENSVMSTSNKSSRYNQLVSVKDKTGAKYLNCGNCLRAFEYRAMPVMAAAHCA